MKHETFPNDGTPGRRENKKRAELTLLCDVRQGTRPWKLVRLEEISQTGFRIAWLPGASLDKLLRIRIPGLKVLSAEIRWQKDKAVGCRFVEALHVAVFDHIVRQARPD